MRALKVLILTALSFSLLAQGATPLNTTQCQSLADYRDHKLLEDTEYALKKWRNASEGLEDYRRLRATTLSNSTIGKYYTLNAVGQIDALVTVLKATADVVSAVVPQAWIAQSLGEALPRTQTVYKLVVGANRSRGIPAIMRDNTGTEVTKLALRAGGYTIGRAGAGLISTAQTLTNAKLRSDDRKATLDRLKQTLTELDSKVRLYDAFLNTSTARIAGLNSVKRAIDQYCGGSTQLPTPAQLNNRAFKAVDGDIAISLEGEWAFVCFWTNRSHSDAPAFDLESQGPLVNHNVSVPGLGIHKAKFDDQKGTLRFKPGPYRFSGREFQLVPSQQGFRLMENSTLFATFSSARDWNDAKGGSGSTCQN